VGHPKERPKEFPPIHREKSPRSKTGEKKDGKNPPGAPQNRWGEKTLEEREIPPKIRGTLARETI